MNICTIATEGEWVDIHAARWLRYVRANVPDAVCHLILAADDPVLMDSKHPVIGAFDKVKSFPLSTADRPWFNEVRMGVTTLFGVDEMLYLDADADVLADLNAIPALSDKPLMWVRSPVIHRDWYNMSQRCGYGMPDGEANNCLLYMREDFTERYAAATGIVAKHDASPRIAGTMRFNVMLRENPECYKEIPQDDGRIWWECQQWTTMKVCQYCNDQGKAKRERLEALWRAMR